jgi:hypothetical protein
MHFLRLISTSLFLTVVIPMTVAAQSSQAVGSVEARKAIEAGYAEWGIARVAKDKDTFEKMLSPDLYVQLSDRRLTRQQFIDRISSYPQGVTLTRFEASVLTIEPKGNDWVATIVEKIEYERKDAEGRIDKVYMAWVTRDGWRRVTSDKRQVLFSEEISHEQWKGAPPPIANW